MSDDGSVSRPSRGRRPRSSPQAASGAVGRVGLDRTRGASRKLRGCKHQSGHHKIETTAVALGVTESPPRAVTTLLLSRILSSGRPRMPGRRVPLWADELSERQSSHRSPVGDKPEAVDLARDRCVSALLPSSGRRSGRPALWAECDRALGAERSDPLVAEPNRGAPGRRRAAAVPWVTRSG